MSPGFLFAALLWHEVLAAWKDNEKRRASTPIPALYGAMDQVLQAQREKLAIPHRFGADMKEIWAMQPRFLQRFGKRPYRLLEHPRFRAGYDFLLLRCESGEIAARDRRVVDALPARRARRSARRCWCATARRRASGAGGAGAAAAAARAGGDAAATEAEG